LHLESFSIFYFFVRLGENADTKTIRVCIFARLPKIIKSFAKPLEGCLQRFYQKSKMSTRFGKLVEMVLASSRDFQSIEHLQEYAKSSWHFFRKR
jgi:hypothetical protein